jgi:hypothetical protein
MDELGATRTTRRFALGAVAVTAMAATVRWQSRGRVLTQRGVTGGGVVAVAGGQAAFSLFGTRLIPPPDAPEIVGGVIRWVDLPTGLTLAATDITRYDVVERDPGETRRIEGTMSLNGAGSYPFVMEVTDAGAPGSGLDTVSFGVGDGVTTTGAATPAAGLGFSYAASGAVTGDIQIVEFDIDLETGVAVAATPTG